MRRMMKIVVRFAACSVLMLTGYGGSIKSEVRADTPAPVVVLGVKKDWQPPTPSEAAILADRILRRKDDRLLLSEKDRLGLANEIDSVLSRIRYAHPAVEDISARLPYEFGVLALKLEPKLFEAVASHFTGVVPSSPVVLRTGHGEFDTLNERLGLSVVKSIYTGSRLVYLYFNKYLNVPAAAKAYSAMEGIEYAGPNAYLIDGSDIDAEKSVSGWRVTIVRKWGDCSAGCLRQKRYSFFVDDASVKGWSRCRRLPDRMLFDIPRPFRFD